MCLTDEENEAPLGDVISQFNASDDEGQLCPAAQEVSSVQT